MNDVLLISLCTLSVIGLSILIIMFMENGFNKWVYILHIPIVIILWTLFAFIPDRPEVEYRYHKIYNVGDSQASVAYTKKGKKYIDILEETNSVANPEEQALKEIICAWHTNLSATAPIQMPYTPHPPNRLFHAQLMLLAMIRTYFSFLCIAAPNYPSTTHKTHVS